ncbi:unnamed protein product [Closterium sp. NIES-64]|nr:unnamed protein product [Closterium sp. NIES-64]
MTQFLTLLSFSSPHPLLLSSPPPLPLSSPPPLPLSSPPPLPISSPPLLPISSRPPLPSPLHLPSPSPPPPLLISPPPPFHLSSPPPLPSPSPLPLPSPLHLLPPSPPHLLFPSPSLPREHNPLFLPTRPALSSARQLTAASSESHRALVQVHTGNNLPLLSPQPSHNPLPPPSLCLPAASSESDRALVQAHTTLLSLLSPQTCHDRLPPPSLFPPATASVHYRAVKQDRAHREHTLPILLPPLPHNSPLTPLLPPPAPPPTPPTLIPHPYLFSALLASYRQRARAVNLDRALFQAHRGHKLMRDVRPAVTRFHVFMACKPSSLPSFPAACPFTFHFVPPSPHPRLLLPPTDLPSPPSSALPTCTPPVGSSPPFLLGTSALVSAYSPSFPIHTSTLRGLQLDQGAATDGPPPLPILPYSVCFVLQLGQGIASLLELRPMGARHLNPPLLPQKPTTRPSSANSYESPPLKSSSSPSTAPLPALLSPPQLARLQLDQGVSSLPAIRPMGALPPLSTGVHHRHPTCHVPFPLALPTARAPGCNWIKASRPFLHYVLWLQLDQGVAPLPALRPVMGFHSLLPPAFALASHHSQPLFLLPTAQAATGSRRRAPSCDTLQLDQGAAALPALRPMGARQLYMADVIDSDEHYFSTVACQKARFNRSLLNASLHFATFAKGSPGKFTFPVLDCVLCPANPIHSHEHHFSTVACHSPHFNRTLLNASLHFAKASPHSLEMNDAFTIGHSLEHSLKMNDSFYKAFTSGVVLFARKFPRNSQTLDRIDSGSLIASPPALGALSLPPLPPTMPRLPIFTQHLTPQAAVMAPLAAAAVLVL